MLPVSTTTTGHYELNPKTNVFQRANADPTIMTNEKTCSKNLLLNKKYHTLSGLSFFNSSTLDFIISIKRVYFVQKANLFLAYFVLIN